MDVEREIGLIWDVVSGRCKTRDEALARQDAERREADVARREARAVEEAEYDCLKILSRRGLTNPRVDTRSALYRDLLLGARRRAGLPDREDLVESPPPKHRPRMEQNPLLGANYADYEAITGRRLEDVIAEHNSVVDGIMAKVKEKR